jgi:hypothetical protein
MKSASRLWAPLVGTLLALAVVGAASTSIMEDSSD